MQEKALIERGYRKYIGKTIDVFFNREMCIKSGNCVRGSIEVFNPQNRPWINADGASQEKVIEVIKTCPSKALSYIIKEEELFLFKDGKFYLNNDEGDMIAQISYSKAGDDIIIIDHTFVDPSLRGKGIALKLVERVIRFAIDNNKKIMPLCPFAKLVFDKNPNLSGVLLNSK